MVSKENTDYSTFLPQESPPSSIVELEELRPDHASPMSSNMSLASILDSSLVQASDRRKLFDCNFCSLDVAICLLILVLQNP
jgi:hypothetical protein